MRLFLIFKLIFNFIFFNEPNFQEALRPVICVNVQIMEHRQVAEHVTWHVRTIRLKVVVMDKTDNRQHILFILFIQQIPAE